MAAKLPDRRLQETRAALLDAFGELVRAQPYDSITIAEVVARAAVGRSTFYEHFRDKDELLRAAIAPLLAAFAELLDPRATRQHVELLLLHFAENRRRALALLRGAPHRQLVRALREQLEPRLPAHAAADATIGRMVAAQVAGGVLALLEAWLGEEFEATPAAIAAQLHQAVTTLTGRAASR